MTNRVEYVIDKNTGEIFEHTVSVKKVHVAGQSLVSNMQSISVARIDDDTFYVFKFKGGNIVSKYSVHVPSTIQVKYPLLVEDDGEHLHASDSSNNDIVLDRPLLLSNFDLHEQTLSGDIYRCKPFFIVNETGKNHLLDDYELERQSYFYYVGVDSDGLCKLFVPPLSNVYDDGRVCSGNTVMRLPVPSGVKAVQLKDHFSLSMSNSDLSTNSLTHYARWDLLERHRPNIDMVRSNKVSGERNEIVQAVVDLIRGRR